MNLICARSRQLPSTLQMTKMSYDLTDWCELVLTSRPIRTHAARPLSMATIAPGVVAAGGGAGGVDGGAFVPAGQGAAWRARRTTEGAAARWSVCLDVSSREPAAASLDARHTQLMKVAQATRHYMCAAVAYESQRTGDGGEMCVHMPLLHDPAACLHASKAFQVQVCAIAAVCPFLKQDCMAADKRDQSLRITFHLVGDVEAQLMNDIGNGVYSLTSLLSAALSGQVRFLAKIVDEKGKGA